MPTIAHLSDIHLAPLPRPRLRDASLKRLTGYVNWHRRRKHLHRAETLARIVEDIREAAPDHILVGGDLTNIGLPAEHEAAARWLEALGTPEVVTAVPGNHDTYVRHRSDPGIARWAPWMGGEGRPMGFPFVRRLGEVAIVGLSSAVPTPPFMASGRLGGEQLAALERLLRELRGEGLARVVLIHHPPLAGLARPTRALTDAAGLAAVLASAGAELVLFGHNHRSIAATADGPEGPIPVIGVPSASASPPGHEPPARWNLFRIERQAGGFRIEMAGREIDDAGRSVREVERRVLSP